MNMKIKLANSLIDFIDNSPTAFHATNNLVEMFEKESFKKLDLSDSWSLKKGGKYYIVKNGSAIIAFKIGNNPVENGFKIIASHTDSPGFRIKPNPEISKESNYISVNTEVYGGPILNTWLDRPLGIAGKVSILGKDLLRPEERLVDLEESIIIPNLAIHMNREVNKGFKLNPQIHMQPILGMIDKSLREDGLIIDSLSKKLSVDPSDILDFELYLYPKEKGDIIGFNKEFISVPKLDNLAMAYNSAISLIDTEIGSGVQVFVSFDNEEVGSSTKQGAASPLLRYILERIFIGLSKEREDYFRALEKSFIISADMAHAVHPNFLDKTDPTNRPIINKGPVIKIAANHAYTTDSHSASVYEGICKSLEIPVQKFVNRSDLVGGSTIGPISSTQLPISSVDIGNPMLAMHSIRELAGIDDNLYIYKSFNKFYSL